MSTFWRLLSTTTIVAVIVALCTTGGFAQTKPATATYLFTNDDVFITGGGANTATVYKIGSGGSLTLVKTIATRGSGLGGGLFAAERVNVLHSKTQACAFVTDANPGTTVNIAPDVAAINIKTLKLVATFRAGKSDSGANSGVGLADAGNYLVASFTGDSRLSLGSSIGTYRILAGCKLKFLGSIAAAGMNGGSPDGAKATPDGKTLVVAYFDGSVGSYRISPTGKLALIGQEFTSTGGAAAGVDITADGKWAIFGDAGGIPEVDVAPISGSGKLGATVNYQYVDQGANSNNVLLSPNESVLFVSNNSTGAIGAVAFDKTTGVVDPAHSCSSNTLKNFLQTWFALAGLALASQTGTGAEVYAAELGFPAGIAIVKYSPHTRGEDEFCDLTETAASPVSDPASNDLSSIGTFPPRRF
jgi:6-phosphogluconolactonase (cycloisomerase 2 family)